MRRNVIAALLLVALPPFVAGAQGPNPVNLWLVELQWEGEQLTVGAPVKLTQEGDNRQPSFTPDGRAVVFSATRDTGAAARSDIYKIDLATRQETRVTYTPENENSPTVNERGEYVAMRWQPATLFRAFGLWVYAADGTPMHAVLSGPDTTGYYTPLPNGDYALTRVKLKTFKLGLFDAKSSAITDVDSGIAGGFPAQRVPGARALTYTRIDTAAARHVIRRIDLDTRKVTTVAPTLVGRTVHAWASGHRTILMAKGNVLYARVVGADSTWRALATFESAELRHVTWCVVSPGGDRLILTSPKRLPLAVALGDSLEAGRRGAEVAAMALAWRDAGRLGEFDVMERAIEGLADDRLERKFLGDAVAIHGLATTLFPKSHRAFAKLGDAMRAAGDSAAAIGAYRKALELNPRGTDAERLEATAVERKMGVVPQL